MRGLDPRISNLLKFTRALDDRASMQAGNIPIAPYTWILQPTSLQRFVWALTWIDRPRQLYGLPFSYCCPTSSCSTRSAQWMMTAILYAKYLVASAIRKGHLISNYLRYPRAPFDPHSPNQIQGNAWISRLRLEMLAGPSSAKNALRAFSRPRWAVAFETLPAYRIDALRPP
jgi:hypothetical protein